MLANGQTPTYVAQSLGISENINYRWRRRSNQLGKKSGGLPSGLSLKNQQLRQRVAQLETERDILKSDRRSESVEHFQPSDLTQVYDLVGQLTGEFTVATLCAVLSISRTAYYRYRRGTTYRLSVSKAENQVLVEQVFRLHKRRYGSRRIMAELRQQGYQIGQQQVRMLMQQAGLQAIQPKSFVRQRPTVRDDG